MSTIEDMTTFNRPFPPVHYEVAGRVWLVLARCALDFLAAVEHLDCWEMGHGGMAVEWQAGPYADEVARELMRVAEDTDETSLLVPGSVVWDPASNLQDLERREWSCLLVQGVPVQLRAQSPIGHAAATDQLQEQLRTRLGF